MTPHSKARGLTTKALHYLRNGDFRGFWLAARRRVFDRDAATIARWYRDGCEDLRFAYPLSSESIVFDIGGYRGAFAREIVARYGSHVYIFEPVHTFVDALTREFQPNPKVKLFNFGLGDQDKVVPITVAENGSSIYKTGPTQVSIQLYDVYRFVLERGISRLDLVKINIEGGEYVLLKRMLETKMVSMCQDLQIQFHRFYPEATKLREEIRTALSETHFLTYDYEFIWENWRRKAN